MRYWLLGLGALLLNSESAYAGAGQAIAGGLRRVQSNDMSWGQFIIIGIVGLVIWGVITYIKDECLSKDKTNVRNNAPINQTQTAQKRRQSQQPMQARQTVPPPINVGEEWYYTLGAQAVGPISRTDMINKLTSNVVNVGTKVWREGMPNWQPISNTELAQYAARTTPPPLV